MSGFAQGVDLTRIDSSAEFSVGQEYTAADGKTYRYYKYNAGTAAIAGVAGEVAGFYQAGSSTDGEVCSDYSDGVSVGAGVLQASLTDGSFGWLQTKGPAILSIALTAGADGNALTLVGAGDGTLDVSALVTDHICAIADDASAKEILCMFP
ncbi:hypothetical protein OAF54_00845 [bacterium]|nr:hypothetical protein [bacterium]